MRMNITIEPMEARLDVLITGNFNIGDARLLTQQFLEESAQLDIPRILVDCRAMQGQPSATERWNYSLFLYEQIVDLRKRKLLPGLRLAFLGDVTPIEPHRFEETIELNRGIHVKAITSLEKAVEWLKRASPEDKPDEPGVSFGG